MTSKASRTVRLRISRYGDALLAMLVIALFRFLRLWPVDAAVNTGGWFARTFGPMLPVDKVGLENLRAAYPEKTEAEIRRILNGVWDNLGRTAVEYLFLDKIFDLDEHNPGAGRIDAIGRQHFYDIRDNSRPVIMFTAHLANWELLPVCAVAYGLDLAVLFRPPNNSKIARKLDEVRSQFMPQRVASRKGALIELSKVLSNGGNVGLLVDQHFWPGVLVPFFGQPASTNPALAKLARQHDCLVYAARTVRLPEGKFRLELEGPIDLPRDDDGEIDVTATMAKVTSIVEGWVREHPEQWLWLHKRWRDTSNPPPKKKRRRR